MYLTTMDQELWRGLWFALPNVPLDFWNILWIAFLNGKKQNKPKQNKTNQKKTIKISKS